jgi:hypothetical protein
MIQIELIRMPSIENCCNGFGPASTRVALRIPAQGAGIEIHVSIEQLL